MKGGLILVNKPEGLSSAKTLSIVKSKLKLKKVGHLGTLDPFATGLLVCLSGNATKLASVGLFGDKTYEGTFTFGVKTSTDDITGEVLREQDGNVDLSTLRTLISSKYIGLISQTPPQVSAKHINGKRAYKLVRSGVEFSLKAKFCTVYSFDIVERLSKLVFLFRVRVSGGTYIRALARDIGEDLGLGGMLSSLKRTKVGELSVEEAVNLDDLEESCILPWNKLVPKAPVVNVTKEVVRDLSLGRSYSFDKTTPLGILSSDNVIQGFVIDGTKVVLCPL